MFNGVLLIDKSPGLSSTSLIRDLKKRFGKLKGGFLGTLDPMATGVMVYFFGASTRLIPFFEPADKSYTAELKLGYVSDSFDTTSKITATNKKKPKQKQIEEYLSHNTGLQWQTQPIFSALKRKGVRAYTLARKGKKVEMGKRQVEIHLLQLLSFSENTLKIRMDCSSGTYVRSFIHELGQFFGCGAVMSNLRRNRVGNFTDSDEFFTDQKQLTHLSLLEIQKRLISPSILIQRYISWEGKCEYDKKKALSISLSS